MKKKRLIILIAIFVSSLIVSTGFMVKHGLDSQKQVKIYDHLVEAVEKTDTKDMKPMQFNEDTTFNPEYQKLYLQNNDMAGWIKIEDTKINYPVMQSVDRPNFYLKHGFDKKYTDYGCPYVQENCDMETPSDNLIIYGHHMNDGSMFDGLMSYTSKSFWKEHKTITFDTLNEHQTYEVIAAFKTTAYGDEAESFKYYHFVNAKKAEEFDSYINKCKELSLYNTEITATYGDKLITLSTCEYSQTNGRMVVVARKII